MPHQLRSIVLDLNEIAKENQTGPTACHWCNNQDNIIKYGKYSRYDFTGDGLIDIQRYLCKHDQCRRTFSILPHPFLRYTRTFIN
jgi:transposase-like protein